MATNWNQDARLVRDILLSAGWSIEDGYELLGLADLTYDNGDVELEVEHVQESNSLRITIYRRLVDIDVRVQYDDRLRHLLDLIVSEQQNVNEDNWDGFLRRIQAVCPHIVVLETDADGNVQGRPLSVDE